MGVHTWTWLLSPAAFLLAVGLPLTGCQSTMDSMHNEQIQTLRARVSSHETAVRQVDDPKAAQQETMGYISDCVQTMEDMEHSSCTMMHSQQMQNMMQPMDHALDAHQGQMMNLSDVAEMRRETSRHSGKMMRTLEELENTNHSDGQGCGHM
jgi:hypothetical protein